MAMKMSVFGHVVVLVTLFVFLQCKVHAEIHVDNYYGEDSSDLDTEHSFLAGETTPVWLAHEEYAGTVYKRLDKEIVGKAMDYYTALQNKNERLFRRNIDENMSSNDTTEEDISVLSMESREEIEEEFVYPSLLVTMEYTGGWPENKEAEEKLIFKKIIYALTYWDRVNVQLRVIRHPSVRIRIAGIIIAKYQHAFHSRFKSNQGRLWNTLYDGMRYWNHTRYINEDFRLGTFNVVAMMTDHWTWAWTCWGAALPSPNCDTTKLSGLIVRDNHNFSGVGRAVAEMTHMMGRSNTDDSIDSTMLTEQDFTDMRRVLKTATCWKKPYEVHPPGFFVEIGVQPYN